MKEKITYAIKIITEMQPDEKELPTPNPMGTYSEGVEWGIAKAEQMEREVYQRILKELNEKLLLCLDPEKQN